MQILTAKGTLVRFLFASFLIPDRVTTLLGVKRSNRRDSHRVLVPLLLRVVRLPAARREDVLVLLIPAPQNHFSRVGLERDGKKTDVLPTSCWTHTFQDSRLSLRLTVRLIHSCSLWKNEDGKRDGAAEFRPHLVFLHRGVVHQSDVVVDIEAEERTCARG